jgi:hypothetical protein
MKQKVFLGGTCNNSTWREELIPMLEKANIDYFNPVVEDWTPECQIEEIKQRENCDYCLYVITPQMLGVYSIAEVIDDSNKRPGKTMFAIIGEFSKAQKKSLISVGKMVVTNEGTWCNSLKDIIDTILD